MSATSGDATARGGLFASTRWTVIRGAAQSQVATQQSLSALSELCTIYWRPVYLFLRRQGVAQHDAQDYTQGFFAQLIDSRSYAHADAAKGRFRSFLLGALKHFLADARDRERAQKRGGGVAPLHLDEAAIAQAEAAAARADHWGADRVYEREWAAALLRQVMDRLEQEARLAGKAALFQELRSHLAVGAYDAVPYDD
ncbi:MAG: RNA polymerase subunit sigma-24, partial [Verrucomicrobiota bacterium]|nr:RNA polymerase subunit sigma-24 [Verrucomicrobiota bacterium]